MEKGVRLPIPSPNFNLAIKKYKDSKTRQSVAKECAVFLVRNVTLVLLSSSKCRRPFKAVLLTAANDHVIFQPATDSLGNSKITSDSFLVVIDFFCLIQINDNKLCSIVVTISVIFTRKTLMLSNPYYVNRFKIF